MRDEKSWMNAHRYAMRCPHPFPKTVRSYRRVFLEVKRGVNGTCYFNHICTLYVLPRGINESHQNEAGGLPFNEAPGISLSETFIF